MLLFPHLNKTALNYSFNETELQKYLGGNNQGCIIKLMG